MDREAERLGGILWRYHCLDEPPRPADVTLGLGSYDLAVADHCAALLGRGLAPRVVFTGRNGNWTRKLYETTEAAAFARRALELGADPRAVLLEEEATNLGENFRLSRALLREQGLPSSRAVIVTKGNTRACPRTSEPPAPVPPAPGSAAAPARAPRGRRRRTSSSAPCARSPATREARRP